MLTKKQVRLLKALNFSILDFFKRKKKDNKQLVKEPIEDYEEGERPTSNDEMKWMLEDIKSILVEKCKCKPNQIHTYYDSHYSNEIVKDIHKYNDILLKQIPKMYKTHQQWWKKMIPQYQQIHAQHYGVQKDGVLAWGGMNIGVTFLASKRKVNVSFENCTFDCFDDDNGCFFTSRFDLQGNLIQQQVEFPND